MIVRHAHYSPGRNTVKTNSEMHRLSEITPAKYLAVFLRPFGGQSGDICAEKTVDYLTRYGHIRRKNQQ
jgi:hypothetical protein